MPKRLSFKKATTLSMPQIIAVEEGEIKSKEWDKFQLWSFLAQVEIASRVRYEEELLFVHLSPIIYAIPKF